MFNWFKKKKDCKCKDAKVEIHEIMVDNLENHPEVISDLLSQILTPFMDKICRKLHSEGEKGPKAWDKAIKEFDKLIQDDKDFNPWHIAALLIQNSIVNDVEKFSKKCKKTSRKAPASEKKSSSTPCKKSNKKSSK